MTRVVRASEFPVPSVWLIDGLRIRVERGNRWQSDLRVYVAGIDGDCCVSMAGAAGLVGLLHRNEDGRYPPPRLRGGQMFLDLVAAHCAGTPLKEACARELLPCPRIERVSR